MKRKIHVALDYNQSNRSANWTYVWNPISNATYAARIAFSKKNRGGFDEAAIFFDGVLTRPKTWAKKRPHKSCGLFLIKLI
jgi:hypothetical protein